MKAPQRTLTSKPTEEKGNMKMDRINQLSSGEKTEKSSKEKAWKIKNTKRW